VEHLKKVHGTPVEKHCNQFHQRFTQAFFVQKKLAPKIQSQKVCRKKLLKDFRTKKACVKR